MTTRSLPIFIFFILAFAFTACQNNDSARIRDAARQTLPEIDPNTIVAPATSTASVNSNEPHYKCPNNCVGGVGAASGSCPVCGTDMEHNQAYHNPAPAGTTVPSAATPAASTAAAGGVFHYICSNGCAGGAASATACATCGNTLVHNQAYHSQGASTSATPSLNSPVFNNQATTIPAPATSTPTAATNAAGVFHYTCSNGCAGGAGSAVACATCGNTLVHNQAYHN